ncbi:hypothetical protein [Saccharospirillum sp. MSK14-1]|uniref:hypothetical protein n=1 Tax=Saccharospirillum sp. MSK14-1 TaxID=1897632 RepID=UPI0013049F15|nr:hypothetical protein [Saccharospirillum sp. MSK14-1]
MASPITTWEGAEAVFTFADKPAVVFGIFVLSVIVTVGVIISTYKHENHSYIDYQE